MKNPSYEKLFKLSKNTALLNSVQQLLDWDRETYMPKDAIEMRSEQIEMLASMVHRSRTSKSYEKALQALIDIKTGEIVDDRLSPAQIAALQHWRRDYIHEVKLPTSFVKQFAKATSTASHVWQEAKQHNDFKKFAPYLEKVIKFSRKKADLLGYKEHPYDALLDLYEPGMTASFLTPLFGKLKHSLSQLLMDIKSKPQIDDSFLNKPCSTQQQLEFARLIQSKMGFSPDKARLDISVHPFCNGPHPKDVRMTTKIQPDNIMTNIGAIIHEGGHGLYELGLPSEHFGSPLCEAVSLGIHESQSRWWETIVGQSQSFWQYFFPLLQKEFQEQFGSIHLDQFYKAINLVKPSLIRIEADEVTYNLHIIVRFEIEKALLDGSLKVKDIPHVWNEKMRENLGIVPESSGQGCLQDVHWSFGLIGYFPTYTLGNLYAAQFFEVFEKEFPDWKQKIAHGSFDFMREWLKEHIHKYGRQFTPKELCERITKKPLSAEPFIAYLKSKYSALYHL